MAIYFGETPKERFNKKATLILDFTENLYKDSNNFSIAPKSFSEVFSFTRGSTKTGTTKVGLRTAGSNTPVENEWNPVTNNFEGLSIHEQRTNLLLHSEALDNAYWSKVGVTIDANAVNAPDGTLTADKIVEDTSTVVHDIRNQYLSVSAADYTFSFFAKPAGRDWVFAIFGGAEFNAQGVYFNLVGDGVVGTEINGATATIKKVNDGWYKCSMTAPADQAGPEADVYIRTTTGDNINGHTGDGTSGLYIWGAQLEQG